MKQVGLPNPRRGNTGEEGQTYMTWAQIMEGHTRNSKNLILLKWENIDSF